MTLNYNNKTELPADYILILNLYLYRFNDCVTAKYNWKYHFTSVIKADFD